MSEIDPSASFAAVGENFYDVVGRIMREGTADYPPVSEVNPARLDEEFCSTFGMCEMEMAATIIVKLAIQAGHWGVMVNRRHFPETGSMSDAVRVGFECLLCGGFIRSAYPNGYFCATRGFAERVVGGEARRRR